jgi:endonuclease/exonuclease/phosphatase (EEP) superfamily protein YafD
MAFLERTGEIVGMVFKVITVIVLVISLLGFLASMGVLFEMLVNYRLQLLVLSLAVFIYFMATRAWVWVLVAAVPVFVNGLEVGPCYAVSRGLERAEDYKSLTFFIGNVKQDNEQFEEFIDEIGYEDPDIVFLMEVTEQWRVLLSRHLGESYPHWFVLPEEDGTGKALLSKWPLFNTREVKLGETDSSCVVSVVKVLNHDLNMACVDFTPATGTAKRKERDEQIEELTEIVKGAEGLVMVLGDLSATTWSPAMKGFLAETDLISARKGHGVVATWPSFLPLLRIPLGHCLLGEGMVADSVRLGEACGSNYLPLVVEVKISGSDLTVRPGRE